MLSREDNELATRIGAIGAHLLQAPKEEVRLADGKVYFGEQSVSFAEIGQAAFLHPERLPVGEEPALEATAVYQPGRSTGAFSYASHACVTVSSAFDAISR